LFSLNSYYKISQKINFFFIEQNQIITWTYKYQRPRKNLGQEGAVH
jgi:hypothetical protein